MADSLTINFEQPVPLFPLASCVLLPHATVPLHIFEPRYRRMTSDALAGRGLIAMAVLANGGPGEASEREGDVPPLRACVCVGHLVHHQELPDGRSNILLQGVCRARLVWEIEHDPYRMGLLEPLDPVTPMEIDLEEPRRRLEELLEDPLLTQLAGMNALRKSLGPEVPTSAMVDLAVLTLSHHTEERYAVLAEPDVEERAAWLEQYLRDLRRTLQLARRQEPATTDQGMSLN